MKQGGARVTDPWKREKLSSVFLHVGDSKRTLIKTSPLTDGTGEWGGVKSLGAEQGQGE